MPASNRAATYAKRADEQRRFQKKVTAAGQDIGPAPKESRAKRWRAQREASDNSLRRHLEICYPETFSIAWSPDHLRLIADIERACDVGLLKAIAMPRGSGKTSIMVRAGFWSLLTSRRRYCCVIAATDEAARNLLKTIKTEITFNDRLAKLYPRELHALRALENEPLRSRGQKSDGVATGVEWLADRINFGTVENVESSGAILTTAGITGSIRGQQVTLPGPKGPRTVRPDLALIDDPQSKESAGSETQSAKRHETMMGDILNLSGPRSSMSAITTVTVIYAGDLAARILDREQSPDWMGETCKAVYSWPTNVDLWDKYAEVRRADLIGGGTGSKATQYYSENRSEMDAGARVGWPERYLPTELSAIQSAYNLRLRDEAAFFAEYQNDPLNETDSLAYDLRVDDIATRVVSSKRHEVPEEASTLTSFVDIQRHLLFYCVVGWSRSGRGVIVDYGSWPDQRRRTYSRAASDVRFKMDDALPGASFGEALYNGLENLTGLILGKDYERLDGTLAKVDRLAVDARWNQSTPIVRRFARETANRGRVIPYFGQFIGANSKPWHQWATANRDQPGLHCKVKAPPGNRRGIPEIVADVNWWKSNVAERLTGPLGSDRAIALYAGSPAYHRMIAEHICAEDPTLAISKTGVSVVEWKANPGKPNNDFFDCLVGAAVLASLGGITGLPDSGPDTTRPKRPAKNVRGRVNIKGKVKPR